MPGSYNWLIKNTLLYFSTTLTQLLFLFSQHLFVRDELKQLSRSQVPSNICVFGGTRLGWFGTHAKSRPKAWSSQEVLLWQLAQKSWRSSLILHKRRKLCSVFEELASAWVASFFCWIFFMVANLLHSEPWFLCGLLSHNKPVKVKKINKSKFYLAHLVLSQHYRKEFFLSSSGIFRQEGFKGKIVRCDLWLFPCDRRKRA